MEKHRIKPPLLETGEAVLLLPHHEESRGYRCRNEWTCGGSLVPSARS